MFSRIRYAAYVLSSPKPDPYNHPGIVFQEVKPPEISKLQKAISRFVGILALGLAFGSLSTIVLKNLPTSTATEHTVAVGAIAVIMSQLWFYILERVKNQLFSALRVGDHIAPFFGRKIDNTIRTLRK